MNKSKYLMLLTLMMAFLFSCATNTAKDEPTNCHIEKQVGFSICLPDTWQATEPWQVNENLKYKALVVPATSSYNIMVMFVEEKSGNQFNDYVDINIYNLKQNLPDIKIQRTDFITAKNLKGAKLLTTFSKDGGKFRIIHYLFPGKNGTHIVMSCGVSATAGNKFDSLFDKTAKTFEWIK